MNRYFKLVATNEGQERFMFQEYLAGRVRFGWSWAGTDLRDLKDIPRNQMSTDQKISWRYTQFLLNRIQPGDRLVIQFERPLRKFLLAEVTDGYKFDESPKLDFNHILICKRLTDRYIEVNSKVVSSSLRHNITKKGQYYQIYSEQSVKELDDLVLSVKKESFFDSDEYKELRTVESGLSNLRQAILSQTYNLISQRWKSTEFEKFVAELISHIPGISVWKKGDSGKGWDLLIQIDDPVTGEILHEAVPVQCKNYYGEVSTDRPIEDLLRSIENSRKELAYLFILGDVSEYKKKVEAKQSELNGYGKNVRFIVVDQETIAELYLKYMAHVE